ncbi:MAG: hypothetical protein FWC46_03340 [Actinomycetia bacterium]|nr:hypothetical protein [Actinomycetes bacterium]
MPEPDGPTTEHVSLGPTPVEVVRVFLLPAFSLLLGAGFFALGIWSPGGKLNGGTVLGAVLAVAAIALMLMERRDLEHSWVEWDASGLTLARRRGRPLHLAWDEVREVRLHELMPDGRILPTGHPLYLAVRPISLARFETDTDAAPYLRHRLGDDSLAVGASMGESWKTSLDARLRAGGLRLYRGIVSTVDESTASALRRAGRSVRKPISKVPQPLPPNLR